MIQIDSREKSDKIKHITQDFNQRGVKYFVSKMYIGDYCNPYHPLILIDRKQNIQEIAQNATVDHDRFKRELLRLDEFGAKMYILIEQDNIDGKPIGCLEDIILWAPKYGDVYGERVYRVLKSWSNKHNIEYVFTKKSETASKILDLLLQNGGDHLG